VAKICYNNLEHWTIGTKQSSNLPTTLGYRWELYQGCGWGSFDWNASWQGKDTLGGDKLQLPKGSKVI
jgi:hypothetical protein